MTQFTLKQKLSDLKTKKISAVELLNESIEQIEKTEPKIKALITTNFQKALNEAKDADEKIQKGVNLPLLGIPVIIKDNFCVKDLKTTAASKVLENFVPPYDSTVAAKLKKSGAIIIAKANMDAWAHGSSTETSDFGPTKNPWNLNYLPGGSSGGTAASISASQALVGIGSETAGSIRQPASWCGVVGLKPTYGRVSRFGVVAMASSLDSPGPITRCVEDAAIVLQEMAGWDEKDATTSQKGVPNYTKNLENKINNLTIGISDDYFNVVDSEVADKLSQAITVFQKLGAKIKKVSLFPPKYAVAVYTIIQRAEVSSNLARYDGIRYGNSRDYFRDEAERRIMLGTFTLSSGYYDQYYNKALKVRTEIINDFNNAFSKVDLILGPTCPTTAMPLGATKNQAMFGELADLLMEPSSIAGLCGISLPCGFSNNGLPIGLQLIGPQFGEEILLNAAYKFEQETNFHNQMPIL